MGRMIEFPTPRATTQICSVCGEVHPRHEFWTGRKYRNECSVCLQKKKIADLDSARARAAQQLKSIEHRIATRRRIYRENERAAYQRAGDESHAM